MASVPLRSPLLKRALALARERHQGQRRKGDGLPYITHPIAVAQLLSKAGLPEEVIAAGLLHDLLEDTESSPREIRRRFGARVTQLVQDVSEADRSLPWEERKAAYLAHLKGAPREALAISCADKLHNTASLIAAYKKQGPVVFTRFSRRIEQKLAQDWQVYEAVRNAWARCPLLSPLKKNLKELERIARRHPTLSPAAAGGSPVFQRDIPGRKRSGSGTRRFCAPAIEVEAKFQVRDPSLHQAVARLRSLGDFQVVRATREHQRNSYFDTDDLRLKKRKAALKLRQTGSRMEVTFKSELGYYRGVSKRIEVTAPIRAKQIPGLLESSLEPLRRARAIVGSRSLRKLFTLHTDRRKRILDSEGERIELDVDRVTVHQGESHDSEITSGFASSSESHLEVEMENQSASPERYKQALIALRRRFGKGLRPSRTWKAQYGFRELSDRKTKGYGRGRG